MRQSTWARELPQRASSAEPVVAPPPGGLLTWLVPSRANLSCRQRKIAEKRMERKIERERNRRREFVNRSIDEVNKRVSD